MNKENNKQVKKEIINNISGDVEVSISERYYCREMTIYTGKFSDVPKDILEKVKNGNALLKKKPKYINNGLINVPDIIIEYRGYKIEPKLDFGKYPYQGAGYVCSKGYVVTDGICNVMPGATWSQDVIGAKVMIDTLIESKETGSNFWDLLREKQGLSEWTEI